MLSGRQNKSYHPWPFDSYYGDNFIEGTWNIISNFTVELETRNMRNTKHEYKIFFSHQTVVRPACYTDKKDFYDFVSFEDVQNQNFQFTRYSVGKI